MEPLAVFLAAVMPTLAILAYAGTKARADWRNEALWTAFLMGAVAGLGLCLCYGAVQAVLAKASGKTSLDFGSGLSLAAGKAFFCAALPEETVKFGILVWVAERHVDARRKQDILPLAAAVSLGLAAFENLLYLTQGDGWQKIASMRMLTAVPCHGVTGLIMGALVTFARLLPQRRVAYLSAALAVPVFFHTAYDFPLMASEAVGMRFWLFVTWAAVLILAGLSAAFLSGRALARAALADSASPGEGIAAEWRAIVGAGALFLIGGGLIGAYLAHLSRWSWLVAGVFVMCSAIPIIFCGDLLLWQWRAARRARGGTG